MANSQTVTYDRALELLGQGLTTSVVASALGVTDSAISQLLAQPEFANKVRELRVNSLRKSGELDNTYTDIESKLLEKLKSHLGIMNKPKDILAAISVVNGAKRRGQQATDINDMQSKVVQITLPPIINSNYITNINNQITEVKDEHGDAKTLVTMQASNIDKLASNFTKNRLPNSKDGEGTQERLSESSECQGTSTLANSL